MSEQTSLETVFLEQLDLIDRIAACMARRQGLGGDETADFDSWIRLKLVEDDYAVLRKFRGESTIGTYLTVVIAMLARDFHVQRWGRWRPSAAARRHGRVAVRLEQLVYRHGHRLSHAGEVLRTSGETNLSDPELARLLAKIPARTQLRPVEIGSAALDVVESEVGAETAVDRQISEDERRRMLAAVDDALSTLDTEDRLVLRMRFWEDLSIADIARGLGVEQKPLYRRLERLLATLRAHLTAAGFTSEQFNELLDLRAS